MSKDDEVAAVRRVSRKPAALTEAPAPTPEPEPQEQQGADQGIAAAAKAAAPTPAGAPEPTLTRRKRTIAGDNRLDIPAHRKKPGWDYEWKTQRVMGQDVDASEAAQEFEQGWRPVPAREIPELVPPGYEGKYIVRLGQILMTRPEHLSAEARAEDYQLAETQKFDKLMAASAIPTARPGMINPTRTELTIEGVVGTHKAKPAA